MGMSSTCGIVPLKGFMGTSWEKRYAGKTSAARNIKIPRKLVPAEHRLSIAQ
jgi:hypothetical protein